MRRIIFSFAVLALLAVHAPARATDCTAHPAPITPPPDCPSIGDVCADGTVFAGWHPITHDHLFIPPTDQEKPGAPGTYTMQWKNAAVTDDVNPDSIDDGAANHANRRGSISDFPPFQACEKLSFGGYTDWYLPSQVELYYLWSVRSTVEAAGNITNFHDSYYWCSTESSTRLAWAQFFPRGHQYSIDKTETFRVRCVRH
jgi:hypothetical protein